MKSRYSLSLAALLTGAHLYAQSAMKLVAPGVWFREGNMQVGHSNNALIEMKDYLIVVDANYPSGAELVLQDVRKTSSKPIRYVLITHHHPDHAYGSFVFTRIGATTIAYVGAYEEMKRYEPTFWQQTKEQRPDMRGITIAAPEPPMLLYTTSPYVITDGERRVELHHFGFGHTRGDTFVYLPKEKVLCTGDAVVNGPHADPKQAYVGNWANEVRAAQKLDVEFVLPGHGAMGGKELLAGEIRFFDSLVQTVKELVAQGKKLDDLVTLDKTGRPIATTVKLSPELMDYYVYHGPNMPPWQVSRFPTQVRNAYEEIVQGKPYGVIAGGN